MTLLDLFGAPSSATTAAKRLRGYDPKGVRSAVLELRRRGLLLPVREARRRRSLLAAWKQNFASAYYHVAARDVRYMQHPTTTEVFLRDRLASERPPPFFRRLKGSPLVPLPEDGASESPDATSLHRTLLARRTVRSFLDRPVVLADLAAIVRGTWGQSGWLQGGVLGRAPTRTSPSGGARHPIECYVFAWRVRDLERGVYHYDVRADALRRLRRGSVSRTAVRAASGQRWVAGAAFACVMTAVFARTLWKYQHENAYRSLWLDAGHLGQTFALLATARGLGAFTTAAVQHSFIERLIGLDGITEFPVYLCGAGVPDLKRRFPAWKPLVRRHRLPPSTT